MLEAQPETRECRYCGEVKPIGGFWTKIEKRPGPRQGQRVYGHKCGACRYLTEEKGEALTPIVVEEPVPEEREQDIHQLWGLPSVTMKERMLVALAPCRGVPAFTAENQNRRYHWTQKLLEVCATCPAKALCRQVVDEVEADIPLSYAAGEQCIAGVWAGELPSERIARRKRERGADRSATPAAA